MPGDSKPLAESSENVFARYRLCKTLGNAHGDVSCAPFPNALQTYVYRRAELVCLIVT